MFPAFRARRSADGARTAVLSTGGSALEATDPTASRWKTYAPALGCRDVDHSRRRLLSTVGVAVAGSLSGCPSDDGSTPTDREATPSAPESASAAVEAVVDLSRECVTDEFVGYTSTTPVPKPEPPAEVTADAAAAYAEDYEAYYLRYVAFYALGSPTPSDPDISAHGFPDVTLAQLATDVLDTGDDWAVVRLRYDRRFAGESRGDYTVTYYVSPDRIARAAVEGDVTPGPDPTTEGTVQTC